MENISRTCHTKEFFINKAIGWALREYAKQDPEKVIEITNTYPISNWAGEKRWSILRRPRLGKNEKSHFADDILVSYHFFCHSTDIRQLHLLAEPKCTFSYWWKNDLYICTSADQFLYCILTVENKSFEISSPYFFHNQPNFFHFLSLLSIWRYGHGDIQID